MTTNYCHTLEEALKRAKAAGKREFATYREWKVVEQYSAIGR
jgi:hypothetical protein